MNATSSTIAPALAETAVQDSAWAAALAAYKAADAAVEKADELAEQALDRAHDAVAVPDQLRIVSFADGRRWPTVLLSEEGIRQAYPLADPATFAKREQLKAILDEYQAARASAARDHRCDELAEEVDRLVDERQAAFLGLIETPPSTNGELAAKISALAGLLSPHCFNPTTDLYDAGKALANPGTEASAALSLYCDAARLAGSAVEVETFLERARAHYQAEQAAFEVRPEPGSRADFDGFVARDFYNALRAEGVIFDCRQGGAFVNWPPTTDKLRELRAEAEADPSRMRAARWVAEADYRAKRSGLISCIDGNGPFWKDPKTGKRVVIEAHS